jgi:hypothetical protein
MDNGNTEADTCRKFVVPKLLAAGWDSDPHSIAERASDGNPPLFLSIIRALPARLRIFGNGALEFVLRVIERVPFIGAGISPAALDHAVFVRPKRFGNFGHDGAVALRGLAALNPIRVGGRGYPKRDQRQGSAYTRKLIRANVEASDRRNQFQEMPVATAHPLGGRCDRPVSPA